MDDLISKIIFLIVSVSLKIDIPMENGRFQKISIPIPRTAFRISEGEGGFTIMEF